MAVLEEIRETAHKGADKAKDAVRVGQERFETIKLQRRLRHLKESLGELVYRQRAGDVPDNFDAQIEQIVDEITSLDDQLANR